MLSANEDPRNKSIKSNIKRYFSTKITPNEDNNLQQQPKNGFTKKHSKKKLHMFGERETLGNFGFLGLTMPVTAIAPDIHTFDSSTNIFNGVNYEEFGLRLAAAHVEDAIHGRGKYGKAKSYLSSRIPKRCFKIFSNTFYKKMVMLIIVVHASLILFEQPSVPVGSVHTSTYVINVICLLVYVFDLVIHILFLTWSVFWSTETEETYWNGVQFVLTGMLIFDYIFLVCGAFLRMHLYPPFRCFRLVMILCKVKNIRHIFHVLLKVLSQIAKVAMSVLIFVLLFGCIGVHLFMETYNQSFTGGSNSTSSCCLDESDDGEIIYIGAFDNIARAVLRLFVLLSTENYPEVMAPAYRSNHGNFIYFGIFIFVGVFFMTAFFLAIIVESYWKIAKIQVKRIRLVERAELAKAWNILDPCGTGLIECYDPKLVKLFELLKPKNTEEQNFILIELLDSNQDGLIDSYEWTIGLTQVLEAEFEDTFTTNNSPDESKAEKRKSIQQRCKQLIENEIFSRGILILIILHVLSFTLKWRNEPVVVLYSMLGFRTLITTLFLVETIIKVIGLQGKIFRQLEAMDLLLVLFAVAFNTISLACLYQMERRNLFIVLSSVSVFLRLFLNSAMTRRALLWFQSIAPVMIDLMVLIFIIMYFLSVLGMEFFHGYYMEGSYLRSEFYADHCGVGFDTFLCSLLMMFQMLTTSNWHEIMNRVLKRSGKKWTTLYFVCVYIIITMVTMNLFVAIAIEAANKLGNEAEDEDEEETSPQQNENHHLNNNDNINANPDNQDIKSKTFTRKAANVLSKFAENVFTSARTEDLSQRSENLAKMNMGAIGMKRRRRATTMILKSATTGRKLSSIVIASPSKNEYMHEDMEGHYLGPPTIPSRHLGSPIILNNRPSRHNIDVYHVNQRTAGWSSLKDDVSRGAAHSQCRVIVPGTTEAMAYEFGEILNVLKEADDWVQIEQNGKLGWISAGRVIMLTKRKPHANKKSSTKKSALASNFKNRQLSTSKSSHPTYKIKKTKVTGNWTRSILGDMAVMDADEMKELNKVMRAEMKVPRVSRSANQKDGKEGRGALARWRSLQQKLVNKDFYESTDDDDGGDSCSVIEEKPLWMSQAERSNTVVSPVERCGSSQRTSETVLVEEAPRSNTHPPIGCRHQEQQQQQQQLHTSNTSQLSDYGTPQWIEDYIVREQDSILQKQNFLEEEKDSVADEESLVVREENLIGKNEDLIVKEEDSVVKKETSIVNEAESFLKSERK